METKNEPTDELKPIQKWLHVWTDAERARNKKATIGSPDNNGGVPANRGKENVWQEAVTPLPRTHQGATRDE